MSMKNLMCKPCWFHWDLYYMSMKTSLSCHNVLEIGRANIILITLNSGEVRLYFLEIDLRSQIKHLETLLFCLFYICYTRSLLPLSPGSGFTFFLLTATQPRLSTGNLDFLNLILTTLQARGSVIWLFWGTPAFQQEEPASNSQE
jgi:hypothetical protein